MTDEEIAQRIAAASAAKRKSHERHFDAREPYALLDAGGHGIEARGDGAYLGYAMSADLAAEARFAELEAASNEPARNESGLWQRSDYGTERVAYNPRLGYYDYWTEGEREEN